MVLRQLGFLSVPGQSLREMRARGSLLLGPCAMGRACSGPASSSRQLRAAAWPWRPAPGTAALLGTSHLSAAQLRRLNLQFVCFPNPKNDFVIHLTSYNQALKIARQNLCNWFLTNSGSLFTYFITCLFLFLNSCSREKLIPA